jgi:cysteine desulfurase/selenocysteine lyase
LIDGAQAVPHLKPDVQACDFYVFSGHKICGPTGTGILYGKKWLNKLPPYQVGEMIKDVTFENNLCRLPHKFEAGTPNIAGGIVLGTAVDYMNEVGLTTFNNKKTNCLNMEQTLLEIEGLKILAPPKKLP